MSDSGEALVGSSRVGVYRRRHPERTVLHEAVRQNLETWLARAREVCPDDNPIPAWVEKEFRRYLTCGILAHGFARARCPACGHDFLVAFSCKGRGVCPSCSTRRMAEIAAHLVDQVFPQVPVRQWVLTLPKRLRSLSSACEACEPRHASYLWAALIARIYQCLPLSCPSCGAEMRLIAFLTGPASVKPILVHLRLPAEPPRVAPARDPPLDDLEQTPAIDPAGPVPEPEYEFDQTVCW